MTCKPRPISGNLPFDAIAKDYNRYCDRIVGNGSGLFLQPETIAFVERVIADGGTVEDVGFLNSFIVDAKANNYFSDIVAAYSPSWGVKGGATASDLYSITGATFDKSQPVGSKQPAIVPSDLNSKTRLTSDSSDDSMFTGPFTLNQPQTNVLMGFEPKAWTGADHICAGLNGLAGIIFQSGAAPKMALFAGSTSTETSQAAIGVPVNMRALFNGAASETEIDNNSPIVSNAGTNVSGGSVLFSNELQSQNASISIGIFLILDAIVDANYDAKMTAIYNFSKSAYGTA